MTHVRHRDYSPKLGRFIERDPIGFEAGDNNWYRFVANGPNSRTDSQGLFTDDAGETCEKHCAGIATLHVRPPDTGKRILDDLYDQYQKAHPHSTWWIFVNAFPAEVASERLVVHSGHAWVSYTLGETSNELSIHASANWMGSDPANPKHRAAVDPVKKPPSQSQISQEFSACPQTVKKMDTVMERWRTEIKAGKVVYNLFMAYDGVQCVGLSVDVLRNTGFRIPEDWRSLEPFALASKIGRK